MTTTQLQQCESGGSLEIPTAWYTNRDTEAPSLPRSWQIYSGMSSLHRRPASLMLNRGMDLATLVWIERVKNGILFMHVKISQVSSITSHCTSKFKESHGISDKRHFYAAESVRMCCGIHFNQKQLNEKHRTVKRHFAGFHRFNRNAKMHLHCK